MNLEKEAISKYLQRKKLLAAESPIRVQSLSDELKNRVYYVESANRAWIVKQAHSRVQIKERWWVDRRRIFAEKSCIELLAQFLAPEILPEVLLEDRTDFILVTTPPPHNALSWEGDLVNGRIDLQIAIQCGELLATVHNETADSPELADEFASTKAFEQLRIDPHYNYIVNAIPTLKRPLPPTSISCSTRGFASSWATCAPAIYGSPTAIPTGSILPPPTTATPPLTSPSTRLICTSRPCRTPPKKPPI